MSEGTPDRVGPFELHRCLGTGGDGAVFEATDTRSGQKVALKLLNAGEDIASRRARFDRATTLWGKLIHPNICRFLEVGESDKGVPYVAMELVHGRGLDRLIATEAPLAPMRAVRLTRQILLALRVAHREGVIHRDIKPQNILVHDPVWEQGRLVAPERVMVVDFGLARQVAGDGPVPSQITVTGQVLGTPSYMAPEQVDHHTVREASDVYSLGLVFYEMLTGSRAVQGETTWKVLLKQLEPKPVIDPDDPAVPAPLRPVLAKAVRKNMQERFATAEAFLEALDRVTRESSLADEAPRPPSTAEVDWADAVSPAAELSMDEAHLETVDEHRPPSLGSASSSAPVIPSPRMVTARPTAIESQPSPLARPASAAPSRSAPAVPARPAPAQPAPSAPAPRELTVNELADRPMIARAGSPSAVVEAKRRRSPAQIGGAVAALVVVLAVGWGLWLASGVYGTHTVDTSVESALTGSGWTVDEAGDGLDGYWGAADGTPRGVLLVLHGMDARPEVVAAEFEGVRKQGVSVYVLAHRGYGPSAGSPDVASFVTEAEVGLERVASLSGRPADGIGVYGRGVGAATAATVASRRKVGALVLEGVEPDVSVRVASRFGGLPLGMLWSGGPDASAAVRSVSAPVLVVHGDADPEVPLAEVRGLFETIGSPGRKLEVVEGGGHDGLREQLGPARFDVKLALFLTSGR